jgi:hypothetical protein
LANNIKKKGIRGKKQKLNWLWWHTPVIPAFGKLRQEDYEFTLAEAT